MRELNVKFLPLYLPSKHVNLIMPEIRQALKEANRTVPSATIEYEFGADFLFEQINTAHNYRSYRNEITVFMNWCWFVKKISITDIDRKTMLEFINFCNSPPKDLISRAPLSILIQDKNKTELELNPDWRPFVNKNLSAGKEYKRLASTMSKQLSVLSSFYIYLSDMQYSQINPAAIALRRLNTNNVNNLAAVDNDREKALSQTQVNCIFNLLEDLCKKNPKKYERSRFLFYLLVLAYPRRSEISARMTYSPSFSDFKRHRQLNGDIYYTFLIPGSKGGKSRSVIVSSMLLNALKRYRSHLNLNPLPLPTETDIPLFVRHKSGTHGRAQGIIDANLGDEQIATLVKEIYTLASNKLIELNELEEAIDLLNHTTHSCRHLGISNDLFSGRKAEEVMRDSGHSSLQSLAIYTSNRHQLRVPTVNLKDQIFQS